MALIQYRYRLKVGSDPYVDVNPRYSDDVSYNTEQEREQMFFRTKLEGTFTFQRADFDLINNAPFQTEFLIDCQENINGTWTSIIVSRFFKTDLSVDVDNKTIEVAPISLDDYEKILNSLDKEFDLIQLEPPTVEVNYVKQSVFQIYLPGSEFISNFTDGMFWELPCSPFSTTQDPGETGTNDNHLAMLTQYGFDIYRPGGGFNYAYAIITGSGISPDVTGLYKPISYNPVGLPFLPMRRLDGVYDIISQPLAGNTVRHQIRRVSDNVIMYNSGIQASPWSPFGQPPHSDPNQIFTSATDPNSKVEAFLFMPYVRLLTSRATVGASTTVLLTDDDPFPHGNFTHALPIQTNNLIISDGNDTNPTRWRKFDDSMLHYGGKYFTKPANAETLMPVMGSTWTGASMWFYLDATLRATQQLAGEAILLKHGYKLSDVINVLLTEIGTTCDHQDAAAYSDFLYAASNVINGSRKVPVITPKSNIIVGEYDQPAIRAKIRLSEVLSFIKYFWNAYWHIENSKFRIEHIDFYENGNQYTTPNIGADLTTQLEARTGLGWGYRTNKYTYDKSKLPERKEYSWMDKVSIPFEGYPIQINSLYVEKGNIEQNSITLFTSDIDYINVAGDDISKEGFVVFNCEENAGVLTVPFLEVVVAADEIYRLQNGYMSMTYAHNTYHKHGLPATDVNINRADTTAISTIRTKIQEIEIALSEEINPYELVTTTIGTGRIKGIEKNLSSKALKIVFLHDTN